MLRRRAETVRFALPLVVLLVATPAAIVATAGALPADRISLLTLVLGLAAVGAGIVVGGKGEVAMSASFIVTVLAAAFLGPISAAGTAIVAEITATLVQHTGPRSALLINTPTAILPALAAAAVIKTLAPAAQNDAGFYLSVTLGGFIAMLLGFILVAVLTRLVHPDQERQGLKRLLEYLPSAALAILLTVAGTSITLEVGDGGITFALAGVFAFSYMAHLLHRSRQRAQQYVSLSWGVLAGLMRALDVRDQRAARHAAAVAHFSRDMAQAVGMGEAQCELAHTAGLLHDIGRFALSDRVAERGRVLTDEDWVAIHRHPELGADMLRDLGMYGPVAEIVLAHHERIDGRGYPRRLPAGEIPEIAKIIAVAEVYDTLTAADTYRTRMSSFEALTELRRVADTQVDARYVEVLAQLLTGEGVDYRHADLADFDSELDMERRITQAGAGA